MSLDANKTAEIVRRAVAEDVGSGDLTTLLTVSEKYRVEGEIVAKEEGIIAGLDVACEVYRQVDDGILFVPRVKDGH